MKNAITFRLWSCLFAVLFASAAFSQSNTGDLATTLKPKGLPDAPANTLLPVAVNTKVLRSFELSFNGARDTYWATDHNMLVAGFTLGDRQAYAWFNKSGSLLHTIFNGAARHLPGPETRVVRSAYPGFEITNTQEIFFHGEKLWVVLLQNCSEIIRVTVMDNEVNELAHYRRAS